ncbi:zinc-dependent alcohol dehydrogenase family protein [Cellulomonas sp. Root137]|uniref:zinc-dependent alcohol dehydrogenase family protein n=1 Tax=Cellulomonas sp. Root137 TaxID=1736459 RepID=UPI0006F1D0F2|nr:zinc-dependent alcohol dehydrogenase family protein [Cellulomonas sp. Root137]KQY47602.1 IMP dehydrogenase [Cellulomonas sp. Root137]KRD44727.1 IMP dehydrogenase [Cellulomonas sp. Root930]
MRGAIIYGPNDVRFEERPDPTIVEPTDAVIRTVAACVCGSDLWRYRGLAEVATPVPIGHEYVGIVEQVGDAVTTVKPGDFVVGGFLHSDNTCPVCRKGMHSACQHGGGFDGCQAEKIRIPNADGTLIATPGQPDADLVPSLLALSDVMATGWHAAVSAGVGPGTSVVVVGDGAVGLSGVLAAAQLGATTIIAMSRHADRQKVATEFGATHIVAERGEDGLAQVRALTEGIGADAVLECVGTEEARLQAVECARPGGMIGLVGVPHGDLPTEQIFWSNKGSRGGPAPVRAYLPHLIDLVWSRQIDPGKVFDLTLPLSEVAEAYRAMDERRAIKVLLQP